MRSMRTGLPVITAAVLAVTALTPVTAFAAAPPATKATAAAAATASTQSTVVYEQGRSGGLLLHDGNLESKSAWEGSWQSKTVRYPLVAGYPVNIGYIKITDNLSSSYSTATVKAGGVGYNYVEVEFYAPAFRGYDYTVEIRALPL
ncbi:MBF2 family protein [Streptomyces klenkii]|uniref:MBF2 family protein n=1 Tax=Streptomyces klenkii TaxID=1420899 RepID=UPI00342E88DC